jgi:HipA-like C-terminal domain
MRPANIEARQALRRLLQRAPASTGELVRMLGVSAPSVHRMLHELAGEIVSAGRTRQRRHALRRQLRGTVSSLPIFAIDEHGRARATGSIDLVHPQGCLAALEPEVWPRSADADGWWEGLPYPLQDMRPQGYLGRLVALALARPLHVSENPEDWSDDDILVYLSQYGSDQSGNLVVGEQAMQAWSRERSRGVEPVGGADTGAAYAQRAQSVLEQGVIVSSAGGEFPKFTAARELDGALTPHVIVKFSGADDSAPVRRWSDLLVCEHLALQALGQVGGLDVARSRVLQHGGRTFLESERFDRHGDFGRSPLVTLSSVDAALIGSRETQWPKVLREPAARSLFTEAVIATAEEKHWFGRFIANTDMHAANLSLRPRGRMFDVAPAYDMLPMLYAPLRGGEVPVREFDPAGLPTPPASRDQAWDRMLQAALAFWAAAASDGRITPAFRVICAANGLALQRWADIWAQDGSRRH